jgi:hypothetical protein
MPPRLGPGESLLPGDAIAGAAANLGTVPEAELARIVEAVSHGMPWESAIAQPGLPVALGKQFWFTGRAKARFYAEQDTPGRGWALDIGPGSGVIAAGLAERFDHVVALERHPLWCRFMRHRFSQDALNGAWAVRGDGLSLPLRDDRFDLVVVNGVLEWVPETAPGAHPRAAQLRFLRGILPKLRSGGVLAIGIENRLYGRNFFGFAPHGEAPFAAILPRPLAEWLSRGIQGKAYRTWIYSHLGYRRLLSEAGFRDIRVFAALPSYHDPERAAELTDARTVREYFKTSRRAKGLVLDAFASLRILGYLVHSFFITARR